MLNMLRKSARRKQIAAGLQVRLVEQARSPVFFQSLRVPDTIDGRFDLVTLHAWLVLERLNTVSPGTAQALTDTLFTGFDEALREQGTGDMGMGRRMKAMADAFFGRLAVYSAAHDGDALAAALARNVWRGAPPDRHVGPVLAAYAASARAALAAVPVEEGVLDFGPLPGVGV